MIPVHTFVLIVSKSMSRGIFIGLAIGLGIISVAVRFLSSIPYDWDIPQPSMTMQESQDKGIFVRELACDPDEFEIDGRMIKIKDCWLEECSVMRPSFLIFRKWERTGGVFLCFKLQSDHELGDRDYFRIREGASFGKLWSSGRCVHFELFENGDIDGKRIAAMSSWDDPPKAVITVGTSRQIRKGK